MSYTSIKKLSKLILPKFKEFKKSPETILSKLKVSQIKYFSSENCEETCEQNPQQKPEQKCEEECEEKPQEKPKKACNDTWMRRFLVARAGHFKYGLYTDDLLDEDIEAVRIALRRVPDEVYDARVFRGVRAMQLGVNGEILPKHMWITYEEDLEYRYLMPYIRDVETEMQEKREYGDIVEYEQKPREG